MDTIVVPLDGSANAKQLLRRAAGLAGALGHRLLLLCVAESGSAAAFREFATAEKVSIANAAERYLKQVSNSCPRVSTWVAWPRKCRYERACRRADGHPERVSRRRVDRPE